MKKRIPPPPSSKPSILGNDAMVEMNEALVLGALRQHALTEAAEAVNAHLGLEIAQRQRAEDKLRFSEVRYRRLFEAAGDGVLLVDPVTAKITDANPCVSQLSGRPRDEIVGQQLWEIGLFGDPAECRKLLMKLNATPGVRFEQLPLTHRDGHQRLVEVVGNRYQENDQPVVQFNIRDITERRNAEIAQRRVDALAASNVELNRQIVRRQESEAALLQTQQKQILLLEQSRQQEERLRDLSHRLLHAQEEERNRISRELHDVISQNLIGINVSIAGLATGDPAADPGEFQRKIASTQKIVAESVERVHHFARELRPAVLDDLGLIPALHSHLKMFMKETGIRSTLSAFAGIEQANGSMRTALYRIAQEALTNVFRHAQASQVEVNITMLDGVVQMEIKDDGIGFEVAGNSHAVKQNRLGLLGMKERIEMLGGCFEIESLPGHGTTVRVAVTNLCPSTQ
jgi:PAS domain S-box-containing protein